MNKNQLTEELKKLFLDDAEARIAYAEGRDVEYERSVCGEPWHDTTDPFAVMNFWSSTEIFHRIKRKPELRPWRIEEVPLDAWYRSKSFPFAVWNKIVGWLPDTLAVRFWDKEVFTLNELLELKEHSTDGGKTWKVCGVVE